MRNGILLGVGGLALLGIGVALAPEFIVVGTIIGLTGAAAAGVGAGIVIARLQER